jgi:hypothetical protein
MTERDEQEDRAERLRAEPGEPPNLADRLTAAAYRRAVAALPAAAEAA